MERILTPQPASPGIAVGTAWFPPVEEFVPAERHVPAQAVAREQERFRAAVRLTRSQIGILAEDDEIFAAHLEIASDPALVGEAERRIAERQEEAEYALWHTCRELTALFEGIDDDYLRERAADVHDVCARLMNNLRGKDENPFADIPPDSIVVARDLHPSDTAMMDFSRVRGFVTAGGGITGHLCIMARNIGLPAVVGVGDALGRIPAGATLVVDGTRGEVLVDPDAETLERYREAAREQTRRRDELRRLSGAETRTEDGRRILVMANAGSLEEVVRAMEEGADGIGLFRSEFLYMQSRRGFPGEDTQAEAYRLAAQRCGSKPLIIRTLDIGGDKGLPYYPFEQEENPFLGWRAVRISLELPDMFRTQLRAILRAGAYGRVKVMFPMIVSLDEFLQARGLLRDCAAELAREGIPHDPTMACGVMVETPAAVMIADELAREADFFSIGTNDLTQYVLAADRGNPRVANIYDPLHPAVLRSIRRAVAAAERAGIEVGLCGEFAGDPRYTPLLVGLGLEELSVAAAAVNEIRARIRETSFARARELAAGALDGVPVVRENVLP